MEKKSVDVVIEENSPWYQRIELAPGIFTTDAPGSWYPDAAWDNVINDVKIEDAARLRPTPKWKYIREYMPSLSDKTILEIGCNCGFFSFEFAKLAKFVYGIDVSENWLKKALSAQGVLNLPNLSFHNIDFLMLKNFDTNSLSSKNFFGDENFSIPMDRGIVDGIFCSTVIDHVYFPFFFIYKMLFNSRNFVILDTPVINSWSPTDNFDHKNFLHLDGPADGSHHGFSATEEFWRYLLGRLNVNNDAVKFHRYGENNLCIVINTSEWKPSHLGC